MSAHSTQVTGYSFVKLPEGGKSARDRKLTLFERCQEYVVLLAVIAVDKETPDCSFIPSQTTR